MTTIDLQSMYQHSPHLFIFSREKPTDNRTPGVLLLSGFTVPVLREPHGAVSCEATPELRDLLRARKDISWD